MIIDWLIGIGGVLMFTGCLGVAVLLHRFTKRGFLAIGEPLLSLLTIFLFIVGSNSLLTTLGHGNDLFIYPIIFRIIAGISAIYLAWRIFTERSWPESIYASDDIVQLKEVSKKIQEHSSIGFWWFDRKQSKMNWSSGMFSIYGKDPAWEIDPDEVDNMIHPEDLSMVHTVRSRGGSTIFRLVTPRKYLLMKSLNGDWGSVQDITDLELERQELNIAVNALEQKLSFIKSEKAVQKLINQ